MINYKNGFNLFLITIIFAILGFTVSCTVGDDTPPSQIVDLRISSNAKNLEWTAPGDDGDIGTATLYLLRFYTEEQVADLLGVPNLDGIPFAVIQATVQENFKEATQVPQFLEPQVAGSDEITSISRIDISGNARFFYSIIANDNVGHSSPPSNVVEVATVLSGALYESSNPSDCPGVSASYGEFTGRDEEDEDEILNDLIIGDPCSGRAYIFVGGPEVTRDLDVIDVSLADITIIGDNIESFATTVGGIGSFSGSATFQEIVIGAPEALNGTGQIFIIEGDDDLPRVIDFTAGDEPDFTVTGEAPGDNFGFVIERRGSDDLFVGAPGALGSTGKLYRFDGGDFSKNTDADDARDIVTGEAPGDMFAYSVIDGGEINSSSPDEYIVGAPGAGKAYVFFDNVTQDLSQDLDDVLVIVGSVDDRFGESVGGGYNIQGLVDISNDEDLDDEELILDLEELEENADVVVGAPGALIGKGSVFMYANEDILAAFEDSVPLDFSLRIDGNRIGDQLGSSLIVIPDINPNIDIESRDTANVVNQIVTNADIATGAPGRRTGEVYIFFGEFGLSGDLTAADADITILSTTGISSFGSDLSNLFDVNNDFWFDIAICSDSAAELQY
jgi:hypothetical protein